MLNIFFISRITPLFFGALGIITATWSARIPVIRDALQLSPTDLGIILLCASIGAVSAYPLATYSVVRIGFRYAILCSGLSLLIILGCIALAPNMSLLMLCLFVFGMGVSCFDVAINTFAAHLEKISLRLLMSTMHAWFCLGAGLGAVIGSITVYYGISTLTHISFIVLIITLILFFAFYHFPQVLNTKTIPHPIFALPHGHLLILGSICFLDAIIEGALTNWSGIFLRDQLQASNAIAPLAYAVVCIGMLSARFLGDKLKRNYSARSIIICGMCLAAGGFLCAITSTHIGIALFSFLLTGIGVATVFPFVFSAAGQHGATSLASVATMGYCGNLIGPPSIGLLVQHFGLSTAFACIGVLCIIIALIARRAYLLQSSNKP